MVSFSRMRWRVRMLMRICTCWIWLHVILLLSARAKLFLYLIDIWIASILNRARYLLTIRFVNLAFARMRMSRGALMVLMRLRLSRLRSLAVWVVLYLALI